MGPTREINYVTEYKPGTSAVVELKNARFVDVINGCFFDQNVNVMVKDGKIASMPGLEGETEDLKPDFTIDLKGKTVLPGLFNVHCHIQMINPTMFSNLGTLRAKKAFQAQQIEKNMSDCLAHGVTHIRDAFTDDLRPNRELKNRISNGEIPGPRIMQAVVVGARGGYLTPELRGLKKIFLGLMGLGKIKYEDDHSGVVAFQPEATEQEARDTVDKAIDERGADLIKVGESLEESLLNPNPGIMTMEQMEAIADQARRRGLQSTIHCVSVETLRRAVKAGFSSLAHMARDGDLTTEDIEACLHSDCMFEPTLSVGYDLSWKLEGDPFFNDPNMKKIYEFRNNTLTALASKFWISELRDFAIAGFNKANSGQYKTLGFINLSKLLVYFSRLIHFGVNNSKMLVKAGVKMACGNDGGIQFCTPAMIGHEMDIFDFFMNNETDTQAFDRVTAVQTATINSAVSMGVDDQFGSIQTGKTADLAVIEGDPFKDTSVIGKQVDALFKDGCLVINNCGLEV